MSEIFFAKILSLSRLIPINFQNNAEETRGLKPLATAKVYSFLTCLMYFRYQKEISKTYSSMTDGYYQHTFCNKSNILLLRRKNACTCVCFIKIHDFFSFQHSELIRDFKQRLGGNLELSVLFAVDRLVDVANGIHSALLA